MQAPSATKQANALLRNGTGGASPSGKAPVFGTGIPRFESWRPSHSFSYDRFCTFLN